MNYISESVRTSEVSDQLEQRMQPEGRNRKMESEIGKWKIPEE
jgi:hypothetical protein